MVERVPKNVMVGGAALLALALAYIAYSRPGYFTQTYLVGLLFLEFLAVAVWTYRRYFFAVVLVSFLFAGLNLPVGAGWAQVRWVVLGVGTLVGCLIVLKDRSYRFELFHLLALFSVLTGLISAAVSAYPDVALLKVLSMLLLLVYAATGARVAAIGREKQFFAGLLLGCEILAGMNALFYGMGIQAMGNPNSLGAIMSVVAAPILLWGGLLGGKPWVYRRRFFLYGISMYLVFLSHARAGLAAAVISSAMLCLGLRKYKMLIEGSILLLIVGAAVALFQPDAISSTSNALFYKNREEGLLASRLTPWQTALDNFNDHPWFGMGLGTTVGGGDPSDEQVKFASSGGVTAENGSSYLAVLVGVGIVGTIPIAIVLILLLGRVIRTLAFMRVSGTPLHPAIPLAAVITAGIVHATFEDWMFAPGYYLTVFFWCLAFIFVDVAPPPRSSLVGLPWIRKPATHIPIEAGASDR